MVLHEGRVCPPGDTGSHLETFLVVTLRGGGFSTGVGWVGVRGVVQHPTMHRADPTSKNDVDVNTVNLQMSTVPMLGKPGPRGS